MLRLVDICPLRPFFSAQSCMRLGASSQEPPCEDAPFFLTSHRGDVGRRLMKSRMEAMDMYLQAALDMKQSEADSGTVADENYVVRAIGWNDVPRGQVPCALRNVDDLRIARDQEAFSEYERTNDTLRAHIFEKHGRRHEKLAAVGLPCSYCFKDAANSSVFARGTNSVKGTNQVHTRSLHAEENAFLQLTSGGAAAIRGGRLFTTASPCELCSKKAYQLGIADIVYIDPYPGISIPQVLMTGREDARPQLRLFHGAVGKAYHRLYDAMLPIKDEIAARLQ